MNEMWVWGIGGVILAFGGGDQSTVEPVYNDIGLYDTLSITSLMLWYQLIRHC